MDSGFVEALVDGLPHSAPTVTISRRELETNASSLHISVSDEDNDQIACQQFSDVISRAARCFGSATVQKIRSYLMGVENDKRLSEGI